MWVAFGVRVVGLCATVYVFAVSETYGCVCCGFLCVCGCVRCGWVCNYVVPEALLNLLCPTSYMQPTSPVTCHVAAHVYIYDLCVCLRDTVAFLLAGFVLCADR